MNRTTIALVILCACVAGCIGAAAAMLLAGAAQPAHAQAGATTFKLAILNLQEAARNSNKFIECKLDFDKNQEWVNSERKKKKTELDVLNDRLREYRGQGKTEDAAIAEVAIKAKEEEMQQADELYKRYLGQLRDKYMEDVLKVVFNQAKEYCKRHGYHMLLQDYTLDEAAAEEGLFSGRVYAETLMNKPVLFPEFGKGDLPSPNPFITNITPEIIKLVKTG